MDGKHQTQITDGVRTADSIVPWTCDTKAGYDNYGKEYDVSSYTVGDSAIVKYQARGEETVTRDLMWMVLVVHLALLLLLLARTAPDTLVSGQVCLLLTVIFVFVRHRYTRMFSLLSTAVGVSGLGHSLLYTYQTYCAALDADALITLTGITELSNLRTRAVLLCVLLLCFCVVQLANLSLHLSHALCVDRKPGSASNGVSEWAV
ncbi:LAQU0S05e03510g1_1 [Lachancea quebecensis]|uniref:LAQU0S05e03510g1_1 n=1 Tax=Lachancea quebecensis TaxID=1654605 RepID=A0A0P1L072_9SACH|nr:LAQU0S05e03510g1_1 [Lachancea quebecensis]